MTRLWIFLYSITDVISVSVGKAMLTPIWGLGLFSLGRKNYLKKVIQGARSLRFFWLACGVIFMSGLFHPSTPKWSSVVYSFMWVALGSIAIGSIDLNNKNEIKKGSELTLLLNCILCLFFVVAKYWGEPLAIWIKPLVYSDYLTVGLGRLKGFTSEPSYLAIIVFFAFVLRLKTNGSGSKIPWGWFLGTIGMLTLLGSIYGYVLGLLSVFMVIWRFVRKPKWILWSCVVAVFGMVLLVVAQFPESRSGRLLRMVASREVTSLDDLSIVEGSGFLRVAPTLVVIEKQEWLSLSTLIGHGPGSAGSFFVDEYRNRLSEDSYDKSMDLGLFPAFFYDYGFLGIGLVIWGWLTLLIRIKCPFLSIACVAVLFNANFNTQLFWFVLVYVKIMSEILTNGQKVIRGVREARC